MTGATVMNVVIATRFTPPEVADAWMARIQDALGDDGRVVTSTSEAELVELAHEADVWVAGVFTPRILAAARSLKWLHGYGAGVERLLFPELVESNITITNGRGSHAVAMSEFALLAMLAWTHHWPALHRAQAQRQWLRVLPDDLEGKVLGLLGYGEIGRAVAQRAQALGMRTVACRRHVTQPSSGAAAGHTREYGPQDFHAFLGACDFVFNSLPHTPETHGLMDEAAFKAMRPNAVFINVGRGKTVQEPAMLMALQQGWIAGAVLDVFE